MKGANVAFGSVGLKAMDQGWVKDREIESVRVVLARATRKLGKFWIRIFPDKPITKKPLEVRQGKGKGPVEYWVALIQPGRVLFEVEGVTEALAREAFVLAAAKLPVKTVFVTRTIM